MAFEKNDRYFLTFVGALIQQQNGGKTVKICIACGMPMKEEADYAQ
jgi:hypothetical protein